MEGHLSARVPLSKSSQNNGTGFCCAHPTGNPLEEEPAPDEPRLLDPALLEPPADEDGAAALEDSGVAEDALAASDDDEAPVVLLAMTLDAGGPLLEPGGGPLELTPAEEDDDDTTTLEEPALLEDLVVLADPVLPEDPVLLEDPSPLVAAVLDPSTLLDVVVPPDEEEPPRTRHTPASHESDDGQSRLLLQRSRQVPSTSVWSDGQWAAWVHATPQARTVPTNTCNNPWAGQRGITTVLACGPKPPASPGARDHRQPPQPRKTRSFPGIPPEPTGQRADAIPCGHR